ncbi:MAG TPA: hypothetical protein VMM84_09030 [Pyrinomonadaceae bacterium]|nr:hypothetical protein [Pyrinomonadaceae bacterium]
MTRITSLLFLITCIISCVASVSLAQDSFSDLEKLLRQQAMLEATDFVALERGEPVVKLLPVGDKREVAAFGLVQLQTPVDVFLEFYRGEMTQKNNPAILEKGSFSNPPKLDDLNALTIDNRDLEDMRNCVAGNCDLKLSAAMIERFRREVTWDAPDYRLQASKLIKQMLLEYVQEYLVSGDQALIEYNDKRTEVRLAEEYATLIAASRYLNASGPEFAQYLRGFPRAELPNVEHAIVWSKIRFGLKPVIAINHIMIYRREQETGPQVLIASKQIYANHYFNSSLALTAFIRVQDEHPGAYLLYENRSRADGLGGVFSGMKRRMVENGAVDNLESILHQSKMSLEARAMNAAAQISAGVQEERRSSRWSLGGVHLFWWLFWITAMMVLLGLNAYDWKAQLRSEETPQ